MGIFACAACRNADNLEHFARALHGFLLGNAFVVEQNRLGDLLADGIDRIQRRHRILEDHCNVAATHGFELFFCHFQNVLAVQQDFTVLDDSGRVRDQVQNAEGCRSFAGAGLTDEAERALFSKRQAHAVDRVNDTVFCFIIDNEVFDIQNFFDIGCLVFFFIHSKGLLISSVSGRSRRAVRRRQGSTRQRSA